MNNSFTRFYASAVLSALAFTAIAQAPAVRQAVNADPIARMETLRPAQKLQPALRLKAPKGAIARLSARSEGLGITVKGMGETTSIWSENFNGGAIPEGWVIETDANVPWTVKKMSGNYAFTTVDPDDAGSLYVEGPYQVFKRAKGTATSPEITIGRGNTLNVAVGYSLNFDDNCRLLISASADDFATETQLWNSGDDLSAKNWHWHMLALPLDQFAGQTIKLRFTYAPGSDDMFGTGGYMGDFAIDNIDITGPGSVESLSLTTGERVTFVATGAPDGCGYHWTFPGGVPAESTEATPEVYYTTDGTYDVSLDLTGTGDGMAVTRSGFVTVTGTEPKAHIGLPASFLLNTTGLPLVAPTAEITFTDASEGFPTAHDWTFTGVDPEAYAIYTTTEAEPTVRFNFLHQQGVGLTVTNDHGTSTDFKSVSVEYEGVVSNFRKDDTATTFDMDGYSSFPGSNTSKITAYAERFSAPSVPSRIYGAYVFFNRAETEEVVDQIASISVSLYTSVDGKPGERLDFWSWPVYELDLGDGTNVGTAFPFEDAPVVDSEFFIVIDGIPERSETCHVTFTTAQFRGEGGTALMLKDGKWIDVADYFPAGQNHTSYNVKVAMAHSVMETLPFGTRNFSIGQDAGTLDVEIFSYMGWDKKLSYSSVPWLRIASEPGEMTVDTVTLEYDELPEVMPTRQGIVMLSDGVTSLPLIVEQQKGSGVTVTAGTPCSLTFDSASLSLTGTDAFTVADLSGRTVATSDGGTLSVGHLAAGIYIARSADGSTLKFVR